MIHMPTHFRVPGERTTVAPPTPPSSPSNFETVLKEQTSPPAAALPPAPSSPSLHNVAALPNGGLMVDPTGNNALTGGTISYNPNYYATQQAATQLAGQLGGTVVDLQGQISNNQAEYFIHLPNGTTINAGNLLAVLNNSFFQENSRVMDGKIAEVLNNDAVGSPQPGAGLFSVTNGHVTYDALRQT